MSSLRSFCYPIATVLGIVNVAALGSAAASGEPAHAAVHGVLAVAFGVGAGRIRKSRDARALEAERDAGLEALEAEVDELRRELGEAQERLGFAERLLAQRPEPSEVARPR
jgi:hypothetical protein